MLTIGVKRSARLRFLLPYLLSSRQLSVCWKYKYISRPVCRDKIAFRYVIRKQSMRLRIRLQKPLRWQLVSFLNLSLLLLFRIVFADVGLGEQLEIFNCDSSLACFRFLSKFRRVDALRSCFWSRIRSRSFLSECLQQKFLIML